MAKKSTKNEPKLDYAAEIKRLKSRGPERLYLLWGPEDYLREQYLQQLKAICLPEGEDSFSYKRMNGPGLDVQELASAIDSIPFLTERSFIELQDVDLNACKDADALLKVLGDIPDYCTVAFVQGASYEPDGRLKLIKGLRELAEDLKFTNQTQGALINWIARRFAAHGKRIELEAAQQLIFLSGDLMNRLIPEIDKIAAYAKGELVTVADVEAVASHIPEADIFEMTSKMAEKNYNRALSIFAELMADKNNEPIAMLAALGYQMRRLYTARYAADKNLGVNGLMALLPGCKDFVARRLLASARGFSPRQLKRAVELCAETDYQMKSSSQDDGELLKELILRIMVGQEHA